MSRYVINKTNIAYKFQNGTTIGRRGSIEVSEKQEAELSNDYFFKGLKERGALAISSERPKDLSEAGRKIAAKEAEVKALEKKVKELEAKLDLAGATGKQTNTVIDSSEPKRDEPADNEVLPEEQNGSKKKR